MCESCGCSGSDGGYRIYKPGEKVSVAPAEKGNASHTHHHHGHAHPHEHGAHSHDGHTHHSHDHHHHGTSDIIAVEQDILGANNLMAARNRGYFEAKNICAINMVSSPGSGKTSLLERTIREMKHAASIYVVEGDQQTDNDAKRIAATGVPALQINTGNGCHLDALMVHQAMQALKPTDKSLIFIENVGNLVCPALFDLGEQKRVAIFSVTEGEDKPLKYPNMFHSSQLCVINKIDLLPYLNFNIELAKENILKVNPNANIIEVSVTSGEGLELWKDWITKQLAGS